MTTAPSEWVFEVGEEEFEERVVKASFDRPVVIDFWAEWCGPCRMLAPVLEKLVRERNGEVLLAKVDIEANQQLAAIFQIQSIPAVKAIRDGKLALEFEGVLPESQLREFLDRIGPTEADRLVSQARELESSDLAQAETLYRQAMDKEANHESARVGLARVLVERGAAEDVEQLLEPIGAEGPLAEEAQRIRSKMKLESLDSVSSEDEAALRRKLEAEPDNALARYELGCHLASAGKHEEALELLLSAAERDFQLANEKVREAMVQIFYSLGANHPLSDQYRAKLAQLLY